MFELKGESFEQGINSLISEHWDGFIYSYGISNQIVAELRWIMEQYVESDLDDFNMYITSRLFSLFFLLENMHPWVFFDEFHEVSMFVLLRIAIWCLCYSQIFLFGSLATHVHVVMTCWNVSNLFKYVKRTPRNLKKVGNSDWSLLRQSRINSETMPGLNVVGKIGSRFRFGHTLAYSCLSMSVLL